mgnify:CR=1 FL=1|jgi:hypothetical protein
MRQILEIVGYFPIILIIIVGVYGIRKPTGAVGIENNQFSQTN